MGLPGAGKTTLAKALQELTGAVRLTSDEHRLLIFPNPTFTQKEHNSLYAMLDHNTEHLLSSGNSVIYDANLNRYIHRHEKYEIAKKYGAEVVLWWVRTPAELAKERRTSEQDQRLLPPDTTSGELFEHVADLIENPDKEKGENYIEITGIDITPEKVQNLLANQTS